MNFLGHLLATYPDRVKSLGNLAGDMIRNRELKTLTPELRTGVMIHRAIDMFTDSHPEIRQLVHALRPIHGKYAPVAVDVILDYILTTDWDHYAQIEFEAFANWVYTAIDEHAHLLPERIQSRVKGMRGHQWLNQYRTKAGMLHVLRRLDQRARFPSHFADGLQDLDRHYPSLKQGLRSFYPDLMSYARSIADGS